MEHGVAVVGCGRWGTNLARVLAELGSLVAVCDPDPDALAEQSARTPDVPAFESLSEVLSQAVVGAVALATPAATHAPLALAAIAAGRDVFVEKPFALRYDEGVTVAEAGASAGVVVMVGHILEYHPAVEALSVLVSSGELGELRYLYSNRLNLGRVRTEENILWSFAPHDLSVMMRLAGGEPLRVGTWGGSYLQEGIADTTVTNLEFPGGIRGHVFVSWLHPFKEQRLVVVGDRRMAVFTDGGESTLRVYDKGVDVQHGVPITRGDAPARDVVFPDEEPLRRELQHFLDRIVDRGRPLTDAGVGLRVLRVLEASQRSLELGGEPVALAEVSA